MIVLFGGNIDSGDERTSPPDPSQDTWTLAASGGGSWVKCVSPECANPRGKRGGPAMVFYPPGVPRQVTLMFGGSTQSGGQWGDTWFYDQSISGSDRWNLCDTESTTCTPTTDCTSSITPCARAQHRMTYFDDGTNRMAFLFGGGQPQLLNDTWFWEGSNPPGWVKCVSTNGCSSAPPEARCCVGLAYDSAASEVVLYGGGYDTPPAAYQDTWVWHLTSPVGWNCVAACPNGPGP